uniref:Uncharacterized protein n=1 Tax=Tetranychus urticae TaxID=32264 RepID=T1K5Z6_TETUR
MFRIFATYLCFISILFYFELLGKDADGTKDHRLHF